MSYLLLHGLRASPEFIFHILPPPVCFYQRQNRSPCIVAYEGVLPYDYIYLSLCYKDYIVNKIVGLCNREAVQVMSPDS